MPLGLYKEIEDSKLKKDDLVIFTVPQKAKPLLKKIVALDGDFVEVNHTGVYVNNALVPNSMIFKFDSKGNPLEFKPFKGRLNQDEIFVVGEHIKSYDSRYFNIIDVHKNQVKKVKAIITFDNLFGISSSKNSHFNPSNHLPILSINLSSANPPL